MSTMRILSFCLAWLLSVFSGATAASTSVQMWRDPGCGCCDLYAEYLIRFGYTVEVIDDPDFAERSIRAGVPQEGLGCHLVVAEGYVLSGLIPVEIIERLLQEKPEITGLTLPGMPGNAPGMAPEKTGVLEVYAFGPNGVSVYSHE